MNQFQKHSAITRKHDLAEGPFRSGAKVVSVTLGVCVAVIGNTNVTKAWKANELNSMEVGAGFIENTAERKLQQFCEVIERYFDRCERRTLNELNSLALDARRRYNVPAPAANSNRQMTLKSFDRNSWTHFGFRVSVKIFDRFSLDRK
jgi:hypothetical protein